MKITLLLFCLAVSQSWVSHPQESRFIIKTGRSVRSRLRRKQPCVLAVINPEAHANSRRQENFRDLSYVKCVESTGILGQAGHIESQQEKGESESQVSVVTNRVNVRLDKTRLVVTNPVTQLEQSNLRLTHIQALNIPLEWLHQKKAICLQVVYDATQESKGIQLTHTEVPLEDDIVDTLCF